ncbi:MAG: VacJ family lipoprotein [Burkholderiaceae bacterium]|nr:VacJ family lipoprotein [Burkholderiaceae bacterium]MBX3612775.1 VacJ family lipoprotein [Burkholderiaceae bacterium]
MSRPARVVLAAWLALAWLLGGCATAGSPSAARDPLEPMNRAVFQFNDAVDRAVLKPVAQGYQDYIPENLRIAIGSVFGNVADLWTAVNQLLQGKPVEAVSDLSRFVLNSTLGLAGLADIATPAGLEKHHEDFGQTLGVWGVPAGPYLVLPLLGPSSLRDAPARIVDAQGDLVLAIDSAGQRNNAYLMRTIDTRAQLLRAERLVEGAALDRYSFIRDGYLQRRRNQVYDGNPPPSDEDAPAYDPADDPEAPAAPAGTPPPAPPSAPQPSGNR